MIKYLIFFYFLICKKFLRLKQSNLDRLVIKKIIILINFLSISYILFCYQKNNICISYPTIVKICFIKQGVPVGRHHRSVFG